jgi:formate C-acetyltransferase
MFEFRPVTERVQRMRERYRATYPRVGVERARLVTEFYQNNPALCGIYRRAYLLRHLCENLTLRVEDDELIVSNLAPTYRGSTLFPEFGLNGIFDELHNGVWESRTHQEESHYLAPEDKEYLLSIEDYWRKNGLSSHMDANAPDGLKSTLGSLVMVYAGRNMSEGPTGHFNANYPKVLGKGFKAIRQEALDHMAAMEGRVFGNDARRYTFYKAVTIVCETAMILSKRYAALCREKAKTAGRQREGELLGMADILDWIMENPCRTFHEAVQAVNLYQLLLDFDGNMHGLTIGRLDQHLGSYLEADLAAGRTTLDEAQEVLDCFFIKISETCKVWSKPAAESSGGYTSGQHMSIGGVDKDGNDATNRVSFMMLQSMGRLLLHEPPLSLRVHDDTPDALWEAAFETTKRVGGIPTLQNDKVIIPALMKKGLSLEDARNYCIIGCVEPSGSGCEWPACGGSGRETYWNMANALQLAINNGINPLTGAHGGLPTGYLYDMKTFDEVKEAYVKQINYFVDWQATMTNFYELVAAELMPIPIASATMDGCMEKGLDVVWGGAKYNSTGFSGIGCANVADGLAAIKHLVFDTKKYTARQFYDALMSNWEGNEVMRQEVLNDVPRYGNDNPYVDELARWAMDVFSDRVNQATGPRGGYRPGLYPVSVHVIFGKMTWASPDGRKKGEPLADGISPKQGLDKKGPAAILRSAAMINHVNNGNGTLLNMKFHPTSVEGMDGLTKLKNLVQTYFDMDGMHLQYNVISSDTLRAAQKNPEEHKNLVIRVAGFSAYFVELHKELQDDLISRTDIAM